MPCRIAYLINTPTVTEVTEKVVYSGSWPNIKKHFERFLVPEYTVGFTVDYGACCGVDFYEQTFTTKEQAEALIAKVYANEHEWIKYDPDYIEDDVDTES